MGLLKLFRNNMINAKTLFLGRIKAHNLFKTRFSQKSKCVTFLEPVFDYMIGQITLLSFKQVLNDIDLQVGFTFLF